MLSRLIQRRQLWWPTLLGWALLAAFTLLPLLLWWFKGEDFLCATNRLPAQALIVEGWIGREGLEAAKAEFDRGGYTYLIAAGGPSRNDWDNNQWNYAHEAAGLMARLGIPRDRIIEAAAQEAKSQRTFESAFAVRTTLATKGLQLKAVNVLTLGAHARRSRLVFAKVLGPVTEVGVISNRPSRYPNGPWWKSSERAEDFLKETIGWLYELLLNSGRTSNSTTPTP